MNEDERVKHLLELKDGWLDGEGIAPNKVSIDNVDNISKCFIELGIKHWIYPIPTGGAQFEFEQADIELLCQNDGKIIAE